MQHCKYIFDHHMVVFFKANSSFSSTSLDIRLTKRFKSSRTILFFSFHEKTASCFPFLPYEHFISVTFSVLVIFLKDQLHECQITAYLSKSFHSSGSFILYMKAFFFFEICFLQLYFFLGSVIEIKLIVQYS